MTIQPIPRAVLVMAAFACGDAWSRERPQQLAELADMSLEQLTRITVTSASRREERLVDAPASIFVITAEDIRRSGVTTLAEALRLAPNLQVLRADTNQYVISARGGLTTTANKMLVLMDGRTLYTPLFSGVFYDGLAVVLENVDRIEVISGPGSTLWGTNAVNGVINITTKAASKTLGATVAAGGGNMERGGNASIGWKAGADGAMRAFVRHYDRDARELASGASARDDSERWLAGFRGDWLRGTDTTTVQGRIHDAKVNNLGGPREISGGNLLGRWSRQVGADSTVAVHGYYDRGRREHAGTFQETRDTLDLEVNHALSPFGAHRVTWGGGYRASRDRTPASSALGFMPESRTLTLATLYAQDEFALAPRVQATLGLRAERNTFTGVEWLPNLRLAFAVSPEQLAWSALTRSVRSPSRIDRDLVVPGAPPFVVVNNQSFVSEVADVAEIGYRANLRSALSISLTAFLHRFDKLRTLEPSGAGSTLVIANAGQGRVSGLEGWGDFRPAEHWRVIWGFVLMDDKFELAPGRVNLTDNPIGNNPKRTAQLRLQWNVTPSVELDLIGRHVSALPNPAVPAYSTMDARVGWRVTRNLELSLQMENAAGGPHSEVGTPAQRAVHERTWFLKATWML